MKSNPSKSFDNLVKMFSYNPDLPLDLKKKNTEYKNNIVIHDISYSGLAEKRINAYLVKPPGEGPFSGIIFVHPGPGSRDTFLDEAIEIAENGAMSLLMDAPWAHDEFVDRILKLFQDGLHEWYISILIDLRRGIDLLTAQPDLNPKQLGYVGHSFGALFRGILTSLDTKIGSYVLMAGTGSFVDVAIANIPDIPANMLEIHEKMMYPINPIHYEAMLFLQTYFFSLASMIPCFQKKIN